MRTKAILAFALMVSAANLAVAQQQQQPEGTWVITRFYRVHLRNGNCVDGDLVKRTDREVVLRLPPGDISFRADQINKVEYVKMKTYNEPAVFLTKKVAPATPEAPAGARPAAPSGAVPDLADSAAAIPAGISLETANAVDQAIMVWKKSSDAERPNLTQILTGMAPSPAAYLEFLLEKRPASTPLEPVALALVSLDEDRFIDLSVKLMSGSSGQLRQAAVSGLAKATSTRRIPMLLEAMDDSDPAVWKVATDAVLNSAATDSDKRDIADQVAARIRTSKNNLGLAVALSRLGGRSAHDALWSLVDDDKETNRLVGLHGIGLMADPEDGPKVMALLNDRSDTMKKQVCQSLGKMRYEKAAPELIHLLDSSNEGLQKDARWALTQITGKQFSDSEGWKQWWTNFGSQEERFK